MAPTAPFKDWLWEQQAPGGGEANTLVPLEEGKEDYLLGGRERGLSPWRKGEGTASLLTCSLSGASSAVTVTNAQHPGLFPFSHQLWGHSLSLSPGRAAGFSQEDQKSP